MTLSEIANYCAKVVGLTDNLTVQQAKDFCRARWKMIWDSANWRQGRQEVLGIVPAGTEEVVLPDVVELVLAARINAQPDGSGTGGFDLAPGSDLSALRTDPGGYNAAGATVAFSPTSRDAEGRARIRLHRPAAQDTELLLICKTKCPELAGDDDRPLLAGVDQALCAFTLADLYRWMRAFSKADAMLAEGGVHLTKMVELETNQAAQVARFIPEDYS